MTTAPQTKPKAQRRESTTALGPAGGNKVRKNSQVAAAGQTSGSMRPRANTISHVDGNALGMMAGQNLHNHLPTIADSRHPSLVPGRFPTGFDLQQLAAQHGHASFDLLPRLATQDMHPDPHGSLHTAPPGGAFPTDFDQLFSVNGSTINPAQLHMGDGGIGEAQSPFNNPFGMHSSQVLEDDDNFDWMRGFNTQMTFHPSNEHAIAGSSPSAMSAGSPGAFSGEQQFDQNQQMQHNAMMWQQHLLSQNPSNPQTFGYDTSMTGGFPDFGMPPDALSPANLQHHAQMNDQIFNGQPNPLSPQSQPQGMQQQPQKPMQFGSDGTSASSISLNSGRHSSVTSISTDSITDVTRQALLLSLSQPSVFGHGHRPYAQPTVSSPLSPRDANKTASPPPLPSTFDLQRYVSAYIQYFHPHSPFLHIPTLSFDSAAYTSNLRVANNGSGFGQGGIVGGGGCLILAMSAIGALYESDHAASKELFDASKRMIQLYLEERRKADVSSQYGNQSQQRPAGDLVAQNTPLWLVQAMLLNVIYGHQCNDKVANDIASTHCIALVSLARAAELVKPLPETRHGQDVNMADDYNRDDNALWHKWVAAEERKRTLFVIFHMSSLLVSAYNHAPALMNSEIQLHLPCDEDLWNAESSSVWAAKGGSAAADANSIPFSIALSELLSASQNSGDQTSALAKMSTGELKISTFGCLVLINALHNYIWETRQRHNGRRWTTQETEVMHAHIEPALRAWQSAWASNPLHSLERPNPYGMGPLSADSIPLLDLAYVRLFVNLGKAKDSLWQRDFDAMAEELARGTEIILNSDADATMGGDSADRSLNSPETGADIKIPRTPDDFNSLMDIQQRPQSSKRERHLRKAALYAADSLSMSEKLGVTYADFTSRELPVQSAICAFDCAQVLAEWVATVQERVGRYLGILGRENIDFTQVPAILLLEEEDCRLLEKISDILKNAESKIGLEAGALSTTAQKITQSFSVGLGTFGSKVLLMTAYMLERGAVWPVQSIMAQALSVQASHMDKRAELSLQHMM